MLLVCVGHAPAGVGQAPAGAQDLAPVAEELQQALKKVDAGLVSGVAIGRLHQRTTKNTTSTTVDLDLQILYDAPKYRVHVIHPPPLADNADDRAQADRQAPDRALLDAGGATERLVIFDGEVVYAIHSLDGRHRGKIYFAFQQQAMLRIAGYPYLPPLHLWHGGLNAKLNPQKLELQKLNRRGRILSEIDAAYTTKYYFFDAFDFDLRRVVLIGSDAEQPFREISLRWEESNGTRYVSRYAVHDRYVPQKPSDPTVESRDLEIEFSRFTANAEIDPAVFTLESLQLPANTPFEDHRANVDGRPKQLVWDGQRLVDGE